MPLALHDCGADFAVWCHYKYLCAGPGAIAGAFVHERHARDATLPRFAGWWGHDAATRFDMGPEFVPMAGAEGWQQSNPPVLALAPLGAALATFDAAGLAALRAKSLALTAFARRLLEARLAGRIAVITPAADAERGCQLSLRVAGGAAAGRRAFANLTARGVIGDWREPDVIRLAPAPLYNSFADVERARRRRSRRRSRRRDAIRSLVLGGGCAGPLLALLLARRGARGTALRAARRSRAACGCRPAARSTSRSPHAASPRSSAPGCMDAVRPLLVPMRGRMVHELGGAPRLLPYGQRPHELLWAVSRAELNRVLVDAAEAAGVEFHFGHACRGADFVRGEAEIEALADGRRFAVPMAPLIGADGAGSALRQAMVAAGLAVAREETARPRLQGTDDSRRPRRPAPAAARRAAHLAARRLHADRAAERRRHLHGDAVPASATAVRSASPRSRTPAAARALFEREFADALALVPDFEAQFAANPVGRMSTIYTVALARRRPGAADRRCRARDRAVPRPGHELRVRGLPRARRAACRRRRTGRRASRASTRSGARTPRRSPRMAIENYTEMRDTVRDPSFALQKQLSLELERRHPQRFIPRYSMVMFHAEIPYAEAERRGAIQAELLDGATRGCARLADVDLPHLESALAARLAPLTPPGA